MNKQNKGLVIGLIAIAVVALALIFFSSKPSAPKGETGMTLFYSLTCPHCKNVEEYINSNNTHQKFNFEELEVSQNRTNANKLLSTAKGCGIDTKSVGVPFLWTGDNCIVGDTEIINFFNTNNQATSSPQK